METVLQITYFLIFFLYGGLALYVSACIYQSVFKFRVHGLSLNMLIGIEVGVVAAIIAYIIQYQRDALERCPYEYATG